MAGAGARGSEPERLAAARLHSARQAASGIGISWNTARAEFSRAPVSVDASIASGTVFPYSRVDGYRGPSKHKIRLLSVMLAFTQSPLMRNVRLDTKQGLRHSRRDRTRREIHGR